jgi:hypothetical protein
MARPSILRRLRLILVAGVAIGALQGRAKAEGLRLADYVGVEASPGWFNLASQPVAGHIPILSWAPVATIRFARLEAKHFYWTPLQVGLGIGPSDAYLAHVSTEIGKRLTVSHGVFVDVGLAAGAGIAVAGYANDCDGVCWAGGGGALISPVIRAGYAGRTLSAAFFVRSLLVWNRVQAVEHTAFPLLFGLDVALRRN